MAAKHMTPFRVRNYHIDAYGHINNAQYLTMLEEARSQFMESAGCSIEGYFVQGIYIFLSEINIKYKKPAVMGDRLEIFTWFPIMKRVKIRFQQEIRLADTGELIATASVSCGFIKGDQVISIPREFLQIMQNYYIPDHIY